MQDIIRNFNREGLELRPRRGAEPEELAAAVRGAASGGEKNAEQIKAGFEALAKHRRKLTFRDGEHVIFEPLDCL